MQDSKRIAFINKAIEKTKSKELVWQRVSSTEFIKPLEPIKILSRNPFMALIDDSNFIAPFQSGEIVLAAYADQDKFFQIVPPNNCFLSLRIQDSKSPFAMEIANSNTGYSADLIRLYNLVDNESPALKSLFNDFLNS